MSLGLDTRARRIALLDEIARAALEAIPGENYSRNSAKTHIVEALDFERTRLTEDLTKVTGASFIVEQKGGE